MTEEVHVRFDIGDVTDAARKIGDVLDQLGLVAEAPGLKESTDGVRATIFKPSWTAKGDAAIRGTLVAHGFPGTFAVEASSSHGYV